MDTLQIMDIVSSLHPLRENFKGVFPSDRLTNFQVKPKSCCIVNTAPSTHRGEHWIAIMIFEDHQEYFDTYGLPPRHRIHNFLQRTGLPTRINRKTVQNPFTSTCGAHCIYFLYHRTRGIPMHHLVKKMCDRKVTNFVNGLYSSDEHFNQLLDMNIVNQLSVPFVSKNKGNA